MIEAVVRKRHYAPQVLHLGCTSVISYILLFTRVRRIGILGSSDPGSWIKPRNTPPRWPWAGSIRSRDGRYYLMLDAYACFWMGEPKPPVVPVVYHGRRS